MKYIPNSIKQKVHLMCSTDDLRETLNHVFIDNNIAVATDATAMAMVDLRTGIENEEILEFLNGKLIHRNQFQLIHNAMLFIPTEEEKKSNMLTILHSKFGRIQMVLKVNGQNDLNYPDYKAVIPSSGVEEKLNVIGLDGAKFERVCKAIKLPNVTLNLRLEITTKTKGILITPLNEDYLKTCAILMPVQLFENF